jgi:ligand-binding sensor domain-containing protein
MLSGHVRGVIMLGLVLAGCLFAPNRPALASELPLQIGQYAHTSWTARDGYSLGLVFSMAQTPDGYLWLGGEFGLFRFDGIGFTPWKPPAGGELPSKPYSLLVSRDGTLWIGTFEGLVSWNGLELTRYPEVEKGFVTSLLEDRDGTVWAGVLADRGSLCESAKAARAVIGRTAPSADSCGVWRKTAMARCGWAPTRASGAGDPASRGA